MTPTQIKHIRKKAGLTQSSLARVIGLSGDNADVTVRKWESGKMPPSKPVQRILEMIEAGEMPARYFD